MRRWLCAAFVIGCVTHLLTACAASPRQRPVGMGAVATGPNTLEAVRKQLEGRWVLTSFNVTGTDGQQAAVDSTGTLTWDAFGVLHVEYRISDTGQQSLATLGVPKLNPVLSTTGRVVINPQQKQITYVGDDFEKRALGFDPALAANRLTERSVELARRLAQEDTVSAEQPAFPQTPAVAAAPRSGGGRSRVTAARKDRLPTRALL